ncbi:MAG: hypothetical protein WC538_00475 [Thermoanaerobaculia bacterium]|jgi:hypothetical protein
MSVGTTRGRKLSAISFLFVLAVCAAFAAHERLHDFELAQGGQGSNHHDGVVHEHPGMASASPRLENELACMSDVPALLADFGPSLTDVSPTLLRAGPLVPDDDVGLHDLLSIYRI